MDDMLLAFRAGIKSQLLDNNRGPFPRNNTVGRSIVSANVENLGHPVRGKLAPWLGGSTATPY
jgi:hypothetical protein